MPLTGEQRAELRRLGWTDQQLGSADNLGLTFATLRDAEAHEPSSVGRTLQALGPPGSVQGVQVDPSDPTFDVIEQVRQMTGHGITFARQAVPEHLPFDLSGEADHFQALTQAALNVPPEWQAASGQVYPTVAEANQANHAFLEADIQGFTRLCRDPGNQRRPHSLDERLQSTSPSRPENWAEALRALGEMGSNPDIPTWRQRFGLSDEDATVLQVEHAMQAVTTHDITIDREFVERLQRDIAFHAQFELFYGASPRGRQQFGVEYQGVFVDEAANFPEVFVPTEEEIKQMYADDARRGLSEDQQKIRDRRPTLWERLREGGEP